VVNKQDLISRYEQAFTGARPAFVVRAPGRVNLIGEHTDYNDGLVLPIAMSQALHVVIGTSGDDTVEARSSSFAEPARFSAVDPGPPGVAGMPAWSNYVRGVAALLVKAGVRLRGAKLLIHSEVPIGGGVSSSAALEVGSAMAFLALAGEKMEPVPMALLARQAEHQYAGSPCGIMDQFICALGREFYALLLDCRTQEYEHIPLPFDNAVLAVIDTQVKHNIGGSEYPVRQQQCGEGLAVLKSRYPQLASLRDVKPNMLYGQRSAMDPVIFQRCQHVVTEIERTNEAADALRHGKLDVFGSLMFDSHASLRDDYAVSCPELDSLVEIARNVRGVYGARMTGGGFGGCAIALVEPSAVEPLEQAVRADYDGHFEKPALMYTTTASDGAGVQPA
jgi:galactokinase